MSRIRVLILPLLLFLAVLGLACSQWIKLWRGRTLASDFLAKSRVVEFSEGEPRTIDGRRLSSYLFTEDGKTREFLSYKRLPLPPDGRVRIGPAPGSRPNGKPSETAEIAVPLNGPDTVDTIHQELLGHALKDDIVKASVVSTITALVGILTLILERILVRAMRRRVKYRYR